MFGFAKQKDVLELARAVRSLNVQVTRLERRMRAVSRNWGDDFTKTQQFDGAATRPLPLKLKGNQ